jgi:hypothetical protein
VLQGWLQENADYGTLKQSALSLGYVRPGDEADFVDDTPSEAPYSRVGVGVARSPAGMNYITIIFAA